MKQLIIDGYNAISKIREFNLKKDISLEVSRLSFIKAMVDFRQRNHLFEKIVVVFDGKGEGLGFEQQSYRNIEALFSKKDKDADAVIVDILKGAPQKNKITVCSDDNFVRNHARAFGAGIMAIKELEVLISLKKEKIRSKIIEKDLEDSKLEDITRELKRHWGID
jgi:predicted RNA-binding protein with PIN domain